MNCIRNSLEDITNFLNPYRVLVDSHMVNFFTHRLWEKHVPLSIRKEAEDVSVDEVLKEFLCFSNKDDSYPEKGSRCVEINKFVKNARSLYLSNFSKCLCLNELQTLMDSWGCTDCNIVLDQFFMSPKKSHEVEVTSSIVASMFKAFDCSHVVDVGGGKGYLSSVLCLEHKLKVLGLDSSSSNTSVATKRTEKMQKAWNGIRRRIENGGLSKRKGKHWKAKFLLNYKSNIEQSYNDKELLKEDSHEKNMELSQEFNVNNSSDNNDNVHIVGNNFKQVTYYVNHNSNLYDIVKDSFPDDCKFNLVLTGLHTCGNLASSCLKLFVDNKDTEQGCARLLVNIGCCYHLLTEKYPGTPSIKQSKIIERTDANNTEESGFPMSSYLCSKKFSLSYNSRVLSSQPIDRISKGNKCPSDALFYRALFEVLLQRHVKDSKENSLYCVGHIKCSTFTEYVYKALKKLDLQLEGIEDAHLVQLFNPVLSPRCYGIIAFRKK
ncbi:putative methyltransferase-like protein 25 isoform X2 [Lycorma delicatula]|uniref:putative methyltransferase-like protein 25 isoform X2 n=1 Tax=Lycorma delicatula TaxID=130591 RepID=UPI003F512630